MAIFARVVDEGSFRAAARDLKLAPSRVSETVSALEAYLGVTLLNRSTRRIALTNEGRIFYARVVEMIRDAEAGLNALNAQSVEPLGALKVAMPAFLASSDIARAVGNFASTHGQVSLTIQFAERQVDLIEGGFDVAIRVGWLRDSALMARKLGQEGRMLVAGVDYAAQRPAPNHPNDLEAWDWIGYDLRLDTIEFVGPRGEIAKVTGRSNIRVDSITALHSFAIQNLGATVLPEHLARRGIESGELVELLPDWHLRPLGLFAVWPDKSRRESLALHFVRFLAAQSQTSS